MKSARVAPRWFVAALKRIDRSLTVYWDSRKAVWVIAERARRVFDMGLHNGLPIQTMGDRFHRVLYVKDFGSKILDYLRRVQCNQFETVQQMVDKLDLDASPDEALSYGG